MAGAAFARSGADSVAGAALSRGQVCGAGAALSQGHVKIQWHAQHFRSLDSETCGKRKDILKDRDIEKKRERNQREIE